MLYGTVYGIWVHEWVCIQHGGRATNLAKYWISKRTSNKNIETLNQLWEIRDTLKLPTEILINQRGKYNTIENYRF